MSDYKEPEFYKRAFHEDVDCRKLISNDNGDIFVIVPSAMEYEMEAKKRAFDVLVKILRMNYYKDRIKQWFIDYGIEEKLGEFYFKKTCSDDNLEIINEALKSDTSIAAPMFAKVGIGADELRKYIQAYLISMIQQDRYGMLLNDVCKPIINKINKSLESNYEKNNTNNDIVAFINTSNINAD